MSPGRLPGALIWFWASIGSTPRDTRMHSLVFGTPGGSRALIAFAIGRCLDGNRRAHGESDWCPRPSCTTYLMLTALHFRLIWVRLFAYASPWAVFSGPCLWHRGFSTSRSSFLAVRYRPVVRVWNTRRHHAGRLRQIQYASATNSFIPFTSVVLQRFG